MERAANEITRKGLPLGSPATRGPRSTRARVLAVASGGGHWVQLRRMAPAFEGCRVTYVTVKPEYKAQVPGAAFRCVIDATRWSKLRLLGMALQMAWIVATVRPHVVLSTGAAPGYFALRLGRLIGAKTIWVDSIANVETLSLSGQRIGPHTDLWLTQWAHLAREEGPAYEGAVL